MKKATAIILLLVYLFGSTDASQLLKFPLLVEHFKKHKQENVHMTLLTFLKLHYVDEQPFDDDYLQDMQLPFKTPDIICMALVTVMPPTPATLYTPVIELPREAYLIINDGPPPYRLPDNVFQPPKSLSASLS
ncbi:hypothetical protein HF324_17535 [Chitinophaga oryzae]|uniref:Uncharacterized protein n=1 Tax=Chitinophaga oryzae TaxID=2725414 RepID=A0AAE6ZI09_9BACT|nr:hypothetical protein [Chitinophaga oryzae]QJB33088.1 hypothetical protein HF329_17900 [Chitinophaga oryzae]QJB39562.1 hypothetical protein HF324_17535 [Chitinophaga oryzae]